MQSQNTLSRKKIFDSSPPDTMHPSLSFKQTEFAKITQPFPQVNMSISEKQFQQPQGSGIYFVTPQFKKSKVKVSTELLTQIQVDDSSDCKYSSENSVSSFKNVGLKLQCVPSNSQSVIDEERQMEEEFDNNQFNQIQLEQYQQKQQQSQQLQNESIRSIGSEQSYGKTLRNSQAQSQQVLSQRYQDFGSKISKLSDIKLEVINEQEVNNSQQIVIRSLSMDTSKFKEIVNSLIFGFSVLKFGRQNIFKPGRRIMQVTPDLKLLVIRNNDHQVRKIFSLHKIKKLIKGAATQNFKRFKLTYEQECNCLSIYLDERTIDLMVEGIQERDYIIECIEFLIQ